MLPSSANVKSDRKRAQKLKNKVAKKIIFRPTGNAKKNVKLPKC
jgi:hypothetical protein